MPPTSSPKPHKTYEELVSLLKSRGMIIPDEERARRKLAQIGYYRLSGFWYPCRKGKVDEHGNYITDPLSGLPVREDAFQEETDFNLIIDLKKVLRGWQQEINELRNHCAHHSRIWNRVSSNALKILHIEFFQPLGLSLEARKRIFGKICVLWFLVKKIGPNSEWILKVADLIDSKPPLDCRPFTSMGFNDNKGFPRDLFNL